MAKKTLPSITSLRAVLIRATFTTMRTCVMPAVAAIETAKTLSCHSTLIKIQSLNT